MYWKFLTDAHHWIALFSSSVTAHHIHKSRFYELVLRFFGFFWDQTLKNSRHLFSGCCLFLIICVEYRFSSTISVAWWIHFKINRIDFFTLSVMCMSKNRSAWGINAVISGYDKYIFHVKSNQKKRKRRDLKNADTFKRATDFNCWRSWWCIAIEWPLSAQPTYKRYV